MMNEGLMGLLFVSSFFSWLRIDGYARIAWFLAFVLAIAAHRMLPLGAFAIVVFALLDGLYRRAKLRGNDFYLVGKLMHLGLSMLLFLHWMPGFAPWQWLSATRFHADGAPFISFLNVDKILVGSLLLQHPPSPLENGWRALLTQLKRALMPAAGIVVAMMAPAVLSGYTRFEPQLHALLPLWAAHNLLLVVIHEEVMFRYLLPEALRGILGKVTHSEIVVVFLSSFVFGCYHYVGGLTYVALSSFAGLGYALAYRQSRSLQGGVMAHFALNVCHFVGFTYPCLAHPRL